MRGLARGVALGRRELRVPRLEHNVAERGTLLLLALLEGNSREGETTRAACVSGASEIDKVADSLTSGGERYFDAVVCEWRFESVLFSKSPLCRASGGTETDPEFEVGYILRVKHSLFLS